MCNISHTGFSLRRSASHGMRDIRVVVWRSGGRIHISTRVRDKSVTGSRLHCYCEHDEEYVRCGSSRRCRYTLGGVSAA